VGRISTPYTVLLSPPSHSQEKSSVWTYIPETAWPTLLPFAGKKRVGFPDGDPRQDFLDPVTVFQDMGVISGDETDLFLDLVNLKEIRVQHHESIRFVVKGVDQAALLLGEVGIVIVRATGVAEDGGGGSS